MAKHKGFKPIKIKQRVRELREQKTKHPEICNILNREGYRTQTGKLWTFTNLSKFYPSRRLRRQQSSFWNEHMPAMEGPYDETATTKMPPVVWSILTDRALTDRQKVGMCVAYGRYFTGGTDA